MILVRQTFWVILSLILVSFGAALILGSPVYYRLLYVWCFVLVASYLWAYLSKKGISFQRYARTLRHQVGQIFEERYEINNESHLLRVWLAVEDQTTSIGGAGSRVLTGLGGKQRRSYIAYRWLGKRGLFSLGPTRLVTGDIFGLFRVELTFPAEEKLLVIPYMVQLESFLSPPGLMPGGQALRRRALETTPYAAGVREYVPGDSLNRIHWPATARHDKLMVKEFEQDPLADVWIFVDAQKNVQAHMDEPEEDVVAPDKLWLWRNRPEIRLQPATIEYSVSIAASLAKFYVQRGRAVGFASAGQVLTVYPPERGDRQLDKILESLAFLEPEGKLPVLGLVTGQVGRVSRGSTVVLITPASGQSVLLAAGDLQQRGMKPVVILVDAVTFGGNSNVNRTMIGLKERDIPVVQVENKCDLKSVLDNTRPSVMKPWWKEYSSNEPATGNEAA